jgi:hypothetical protein
MDIVKSISEPLRRSELVLLPQPKIIILLQPFVLTLLMEAFTAAPYTVSTVYRTHTQTKNSLALCDNLDAQTFPRFKDECTRAEMLLGSPPI